MVHLTQKQAVAAVQGGLRGFFSTIDQKWMIDLQNFIRAALPKIVVIVIGAWLLTRVLRLITSRVLKVAERHSGGERSIAQVRTLASVIRATGIGIIVFLAALEILPLLGFKLEPLLASAGVAGIALGLAAQTIVKDCLNGVLILVEDQYNVGDVVSLAGLSGKVEAMTLRRTMVRDNDGTLYIIPNSQITTVANKTREFSVATINVSVDFSADPDKVMKLLKDVAMSVRNDPAYSDVFLADPNLLGVDAIKGSQVIYPVQLKTKANQQWAAMRETQRRIRLALEEHHMLPGDPLRVVGAQGAPVATGAAAAVADATTPQSADPTAAKAKEVDLFGNG
ncbi:MAG TPA: mechanosensitive ion channel family protein [Acidobacteriaceae bacterium]|nr:mechanosensitive ion channel family protein [Acidobacteriaceae bacterium]